jgi:sugar phosphate isomerase/epimerase
MIQGIVTNCWRRQLESGVELDDMLAESVANGFTAIELRQGSLGRFESRYDHVPTAAALAELPRRFPTARFNVAIALPFMDASAKLPQLILAAGVASAAAVAGGQPPHLRLVDVETTEVPNATWPSIAQRLAEATRKIAACGGWLSIENARQSWQAMRSVFDMARAMLGADASTLRLCYDAANLLYASDSPDPSQVVRSLHGGELAMVHLKQAWQGRTLPTLEPGDIDWRDQLGVLRGNGYHGPLLFEIPPGDQIRKRLDASRAYLSSECGQPDC